jgi:hypothetical protein
MHEALSTAFDSFGNRAMGVIEKTMGESDRQMRDGVMQLTAVVQEFQSVLVNLKKG